MYMLRLLVRPEVVWCCPDAALDTDPDPLWQAARSQGVDCLVAPYEADAQLAYLNKAGIVQAIITEDSDLLAFGCKKVPTYHILLFCAFGNGVNQGAKVFLFQESFNR